MNTFTKVALSAVVGMIALGVTAAPVRANDFASAVAHAKAVVASDVATQLRAAANTPKTYKVRRGPSVEVFAIETVFVEASRLPETEVVVVATRLPAEEIVVA